MQNTKSNPFYTFWEKKKLTSVGVKLCIKCISVTVTVYICTVTITRAFNILVFFLSVGSVRERNSEWGNKK